MIKLTQNIITTAKNLRPESKVATFIATGLSVAFLCMPVTSVAETQVLDGVIAIVDDDVILQSELNSRVDQISLNFQQKGQQLPPIEEVTREVLDQLVLESIQIQKAYKAGVRISDAQLNDSMTRIAQQNGLTLSQFKAALEADGLSYLSTREQIRKEMLIQRVQQGSVSQQIQTSDQEIANFLASEEGQSLTAPKYRMLHTLVQLPSNPNDEQVSAAKKIADDLYQRIQTGESYENVMSQETRQKLTTNDFGWRKPGDLPSLVAGLTELSEGETAAPIKSPSGFHLVKLVDTRGKGEFIAQTRARHILLKASAIRDEAATKAEAEQLRQDIINGADFEALARQHSEDIGSALEGGDLGWTTPGQLVAAFQNAMDSTEINGISDAFRSEYGWHILQVLDRRDKDVTDDIRRRIAGNFIHQRKYKDELQTWLQKIRDEAFVDFK